jgi:signal transduction histidine kinase
MWNAGKLRPGRRVRSSREQVTQRLLHERDTWIVISLLWGTTGVVSWLLEYVLSIVTGSGPLTLVQAAARLVNALLWWAATVFAIWISDTVTLRDPRRYAVIFFHVAVAAVVAPLWGFAAYHANLIIIPGWQPRGVGQMVHSTYLTNLLFYLGVVGIAHGIIAAREHRARAREAHARELDALRSASAAMQAQLQALKMELQPHFLFNTLNAISTLMHRDVKAANEMLVLLADMLQAALANVHDQEVPLEREIETLALYVRIQQIRFGDRLQVVWKVDPDTLGARVPHLILQPIVENALQHGIADRASGGRIEISARRADDKLRLEVRDDGRGLRGTRPGFGLGLANTRARLEQLHGGRQRLELVAVPDGGALTSISLPFREVAEVDSPGHRGGAG